MTKFEKAVEIIANEYLQDKSEIERIQPDTISDIFKCYQYDSEDLRDEFADILSKAGFEDYTDEMEIVDGEKVYNFRALVMAVRKVKVA